MQDKTPQYLKCYNLHKAPFGLSPDPDFFFPAPPHLAARATLKHTLQRGEGFMVLIGEAGTGKTLLIRILLKEIDRNKVPAVLLSPTVNPQGLLRMILTELGENTSQENDMASLLTHFQKTLLTMARNKKELLIIIDEAQNLPIESLEQLRMLSNVETSDRKLMQILLVGQPGLGEKLQDPLLGQLNQRIVISENLRPLNRKETIDYINFRLAQAGQGGLPISRSAGRLLFKNSLGIPRLINRLMDRTLLFGCADSSGKLTAAHVKKSLETLPETGRKKNFLPKSRLLYMVTATCFAALFFIHYFNILQPSFTIKNLKKTLFTVEKTEKQIKHGSGYGRITIHDIVIRRHKRGGNSTIIRY
ncbi:ExeA family protein [Desulfomarina sp.]